MNAVEPELEAVYRILAGKETGMRPEPQYFERVFRTPPVPKELGGVVDSPWKFDTYVDQFFRNPFAVKLIFPYVATEPGNRERRKIEISKDKGRYLVADERMPDIENLRVISARIAE